MSRNSHHSPGSAIHLPWINARHKESEFYRGAFCSLIGLGVPMNLHGFDYLTSAIVLVAEDPSYIHSVTKRLYPKIAEFYDTTSSGVERDIRTAIERTFQKRDPEILYKYFGSAISEKSGKVKNSDFISRVAADVRLDMMSVGLDDLRKQVLKELGIESKIPDTTDK